MKKQYTHVTAAISPEELEEFEKKLQKIKDHYGIESSSTIIQKIISEWEELYLKAQKYDQVRDMILQFEMLNKYRKGELAYAEGDERSLF